MMKKPSPGSGGAAPPPGAAPTYARPTPMTARRKRAKVLTKEERAAFLATRPDLKDPP
jgi:hypothetical protein